MAKVPAIEQTFYYAVPVDRVYAALTDPRRLVEWFVDKARITAKKGGSFRFTWGTYTLRGKVRGAEPPKRLILLWVDRFKGGKVFETEVRFELRKRRKGTLLTVTHSGFKDGKRWVALFGSIQSGWAHYLTNLKSVLEHGVDLRSDLHEL